MANDPYDVNAVALNLHLVLKRLRARLREESRARSELSMSQFSILHYLHNNGPTTATILAANEHVSQQAIAQTIAPLKSADLIQTTPDPEDGRKMVISITEKARQLRESIITSQNAWLVRAIDSTLDHSEHAALVQAVELLERLAAAEPTI